MKLYNEPITPQRADAGPWFEWRGQRYEICRVLDRWVVQGRWWAEEERREFLLVEAASAGETGVYEICQSSRGGWLLVRVYD
ncbi:MAG: DUF6504 family protein [Candidatus Latescibacterota bacterium]